MREEQHKYAELLSKKRKCFSEGITKNIKHRIQNLKSFNKFLIENEENILKAMYDDMRKHPEEARLEIIIAVNHIKYLIDNVKKWSTPKSLSKRWMDILDSVYVHPEPYGIVLVIAAWNVPLLTLLPALGAIAAGNCVILKPSHHSSSFGHLLAERLQKYLDGDCHSIILGNIDETNQLLAERFDYIYYTGSTTVGKIVHLAANKFLTPCTLELGGKNPAYIDSSADLQLAAKRIMWGKCFNSGQICIAPDYIICSKSIQEDFIKYCKQALLHFYSNNHNCCPIVNDYHYKRLKNLLTGLNIALGGHFDDLENHIEPTIVTDVPLDHPIMQEEIFGPILPLINIENYRDAADFINEKEKPLAMYIFAEKSSVRDYLIDNTSCGGVTVNDTLMHLITESLPFGGVGLSGMGCYKGKYSFATFVHKKSVLVKNSWKIIEKLNDIRYPPYSKRKSDMTAFLLKYRKGPPRKVILYILIFLTGFIIGFLLFYIIS